MLSSRPTSWILALVCGLFVIAGCATTSDTPQGETGALSVDLIIADGIEIDQVGWQITGNDMDMSGSIDVSAPGSTASVEVFGLPPGEEDYTVMLTAESTDEQVGCKGSADFNVEVGQTTDVMVVLNCKLPRRLGAVRVNGKFNICAELIKEVVSPLQTSIGNDIDVSAQAVDQEGDPISFSWTGTGGSFADPSAASTTYTCETVGDHEITVSVTDNDEACDMATWTVSVTCVAGDGGTGGSGGAGGQGGAGGEAGAGGEGGAAGEGGAGGEGGAAGEGGAGGEGGQGGSGGVVDPCDGLDCSDGNECTTDMCMNGNCSNPPVADGTECDGGAGTCQSGVCVETDPCDGLDCSDGNECTADVCTDGVCSNPPVDDGTACDNTMGTCQSGMCVPDDLCEGLDCSDGNDCTDDICTDGVCSNPPVDDGASCTCPVCGAEGVCMMGVCEDPCEGIDCSDGNQCTADLCNVGVCSNPNVGPGGDCNQDGGIVCDGSGNCVECISDINCDVELNEQCVDNQCVAAATPCGSQSKIVTVGCTNSVTTAQSPFPFELQVNNVPVILGGQSFSAEFDGIGVFPEFFLDAAQGVVPGGVEVAELVDIVSTVQVRSGATGPDVALGPDVTSLTPGAVRLCNFPTDQVCTCPPGTAPNEPCANTDCLAQQCLAEIILAELPTSGDCGPGGTCDALGKAGTGSQCALNGFCITGDLTIEFQAETGTFTADAAGEVLFGWTDQNVPGLLLCPDAGGCGESFHVDGCYDLPAAVFSNPTEPIGIRVDASGLNVPIQCAMAEDGGSCSTTTTQGCISDADCPGAETCVGVGVDDDVVCPTPDSALIACPIN